MGDLRVVVVGAGAAGLSTALQTAERGAGEVTVIDKDYPAGASSGLSAGIFNRQTQNLRELELRSYSVDFLGALERSGKLELVRNGYIRVARTEDHLCEFEKTIDVQRGLGIEDSRVIDVTEMERLVPGLRADDFAGGLYCPSDGLFDGHLLCGAYLDLAEAKGVRLRPRTCLQAIDEASGGLRVETDQGTIECDVIVNAAGAWAPGVAQMMGLRMPVHNERHRICIAHLAEPFEALPPTLNSYVPGSGESALYFRPEAVDRLLVGFHSHEVRGATVDPDDYGRTVGFDYMEAVARELGERLPRLPDLRLEAGWAGLYPISPDGLFQVGPQPGDPRMVSVGGLGGVGLTVSAAVGRIAAEWVTEGSARAFSFAGDLLPERDSLAAVETAA